MAGKQIFPNDLELKEMNDLLSHGLAARPLPKNTETVEKMKHALCAEFVKYKNKNKLTQKQMALDLQIDEALMSKCVCRSGSS